VQRYPNGGVVVPQRRRSGGVVTPLLAFSVFLGYSPACTPRGGLVCSSKIEKRITAKGGAVPAADVMGCTPE
jgi:hypothetical protein